MSNETESDLQPQRASAFRLNDVLLIEQIPCKIVEMSTSKTGKHGSAKVNFTGLCIFSAKKHQYSCSSSHMLYKVLTKKIKYQILGLNEGVLNLISESDCMATLDLKNVEPFLRKKIAQGYHRLEEEQEMWVTVLYAMGKTTITDFQIKTEK